MPWITKEGRTVTEASDAAVAAAGLPASDLDIEVVSEGAKGLFGLGGEPAVVRVRPKDEAADVRHAFRDDIAPVRDEGAQVTEERQRRFGRKAEVQDVRAEPTDAQDTSQDKSASDDGEDEDDKVSLSERQEQAAALGAEIVRGILERMGLEGEVNTRVATGTVYVEIFGEEMGILIGRSGTTLEALQELVRAGVQRRLKTRQALVVDVESYWERRRKPGQREGGDRRREGGGQRRRNGNDRRGRGRGRSDRGRGARPGDRESEPDGNRLPDPEVEPPEPDGNR
ncbi:MAG: Jag N-terminal domain-containing protein [Actinomycetota bacterium]